MVCCSVLEGLAGDCTLATWLSGRLQLFRGELVDARFLSRFSHGELALGDTAPSVGDLFCDLGADAICDGGEDKASSTFSLCP